ncbi:TonB-dependent receptor [Sphingomonas kyeonggiensis]|uniref:Iron complex outermembrane receptor protein n=3 Tax=Pseudomonadota TaxID=1224 RepID=A0A7W6JW43_9SPHN|nr:TonB-dependent receptor [Sphingomonas kyeonggiensis]MBB4099515.1 iron complex outermembrane receptor protein [Sphingomonas kyeonggiensis]
MRTDLFRALTASVATLSCGFGVTEQAFAQNADTAPVQTSEASGDTGLADIVVTAQRRQEKAQSVPISITSVSGQALEDSGFTSLTDLQYVVPGVQYDPTQGAAFQIRGVGSTSFDFSNAKSVNVVVDDVVMDAQRDNGLIGLTDIQRVDVLMGPQGTLFGKNSTSGVIAITTNKPVIGQFSGTAYASYGERNDRNTNATVNLPISEQAALRLSAFALGQDGKGRYVVLDRNLGLVSEWGVRGKLLFQPAPSLELVLAGEYTHHIDTAIRVPVGGPAGSTFAPAAALTAAQIALGVVPGPENADSADGSLGHNTTTNKGGSLHVNYEMGQHTLTSITAYRETTFDNDTPADLLPRNVYAYIPFNSGRLKTNKFSEEIHFASPTGGTIEYLVGAFYNKLNAKQTQLQWGTLGTPLLSPAGVPSPTLYAVTGAFDPITKAMLGNAVLFDATNEAAAAFGQVKITPARQFSVTFGGRYNYDWNSQTISYINIDPRPITGYSPIFVATGAGPTEAFRTGSKKGGRFTYRIAPQFAINRDVMVYASYATGYKPGGVAFVGNRYDPYNPESVKSWEIGLKSELFDRRARFNLAAFSSKFTDFQATILTPVSTGIGGFILASAIGNAPGLRSRGVEASLTVKPARQITLGGSVTYTDATFTDYVASPTANYTGTRLTNAPEWQASVTMDYADEIGAGLNFKAHLDYGYRSDTQTVTGAMLGDILAPAVSNADGTKTPNSTYSRIPGYGLLNGRVSLAKLDGAVEFGVYARNLLNTYYSTGWQIYGPLGLLHYTSPNAYRTLGAFAKINF